MITMDEIAEQARAKQDAWYRQKRAELRAELVNKDIINKSNKEENREDHK